MQSMGLAGMESFEASVIKSMEEKASSILYS